MGWMEDVQILAPHYTPEAALRVSVACFVCWEEDSKKVFTRSNRPKNFLPTEAKCSWLPCLIHKISSGRYSAVISPLNMAWKTIRAQEQKTQLETQNRLGVATESHLQNGSSGQWLS